MRDEEIAGLIALFADAPRQAPSDPAALDRMIAALSLPFAPRAADFGAGTGATARRLAEALSADILALDAAAPFIERLAAEIAAAPPAAGAIRPVLGDMAAPPVAPGSLDLIVSEGAAYAIGLDAALSLWAPLLAPGGGLALSDAVWFGEARPEPAAAFWAEEYPAMGTVADSVALAERAGWRLVAAERMPREAWRLSYYDPLEAQIAALAPRAESEPGLAAAIAGMRREMAVFDACGDAYGYVYLALDRPA